jgi:hypothetical protein
MVLGIPRIIEVCASLVAKQVVILLVRGVVSVRLAIAWLNSNRRRWHVALFWRG